MAHHDRAYRDATTPAGALSEVPGERDDIAPERGARFDLARCWRMMGLDVQILFAISLIICGSMAGLGYWVTAYTRSVEIETAADTNAFYMNLLFEPLLRDVEREGVVPADVETKLDDLLSKHFEEHFIEAAVIWWRDGTVAYSTDKPMMGRQILSPQLTDAFRGEIVTKLIEGLSEHGSRRQNRLGEPLLEVYVPLRDPETGAITAVGEFYQNARHLQSQLRHVAYTIWGIVGATTVLMLSLLILTATRARAIVDAQRSELKRRLEESQRLARQNEALHRSAEEARLNAFKTNEDFLNQIGSDLHDGPIQLLSLIMLRLKGLTAPQQEGDDKDAQEQAKTIELAGQTIRDLRNLAFGLAVPELEGLTVKETLLLAITRHESQTGTTVKTDLGDLPEQLAPPLKICLYRVVQEALNNAFKHAGGSGQHVAAAMRDGCIEVAISDTGPGIASAAGAGEASGLGMSGLTRRLQTFGGSLRTDSKPGYGTTVVATLPVGNPETSVPIGYGG